jgi:hypothetical protein
MLARTALVDPTYGISYIIEHRPWLGSDAAKSPSFS